MRIKAFHINGFGILHDTGARDLSPGLSVFTGHNESGKSTLLRFLRAALFGLSGRVPRDEPLRGGTHGGILHIVSEDGREFIFELKGGRVRITDALTGTSIKQSVPELSEGVDRHVFERVFAVGLNDLYSGGDSILNEDRLRDRLFAAGAGLGTVALSKTFLRIEKDMDRIAKNRSTRSRSLIRDDSDRLAEIDRKLREMSSLQNEYAKLKQDTGLLSAELEDIGNILTETGKRQMEIRRLLSIIEPYSRLGKVREEMSVLQQQMGDLPPGASERYAMLKKEIQSHEQDLGGIKKSMEELLLEEESISVNPDVLENSSGIESLWEDRNRLLDIEEERSFQKEKYRSLSLELDNSLARISPVWTVDDLVKADTSLSAGKEAMDLHGQFESLEKEQLASHLQQKTIKNDMEGILSELVGAREELAELSDVTGTFSEVSRMLDMTREVGEKIRKRTFLHEKINILDSALQDHEQRLKDIDRSVKDLEPGLRKQTVTLVTVSAGVATLFAYYFRERLDLFSLAFLILAFFLAAGLVWKGNHVNHKRSILDKEREKKLVREKMEELRLSISEVEGALDVLNREIVDCLGEIDLDPDASGSDLDKLAVSLEMHISRIRERDKREEKVNSLHQLFQQRTKELSDIEKEQGRIAEELQKWKDRWDLFLESRGLPPNTRSGTFQMLNQAIFSSKRLYASVTEVSYKLEQLEDRKKSISSRADDLFLSCGSFCDGDLPEKISFLYTDLRENRKNRDRKLMIAEKLKDMSVRHEEVSRGLEDLQNELQILLDRSNSSSEEEFFRRIEEQGRLSELRNLELELMARLTGIAGSEAVMEELSGTIDNADTMELEMEMRMNSEQIDSLTARREEIISDLGKMELRLQDLSVEDAQSRLIQEREFLLARCRENSAKWVSCAVCKAILERAREKYEIQKQPRVIRKASEYLKTITDGRYGIICSALDRKIHLSDKEDLSRKESSQWSSGLEDQAYIAIRLALSGMFKGKAGPLPLILDDIHLRFDPRRQENLARVLLNHSLDHQVLLFSCDPAFSDILSSVIEKGYDGPCPDRYVVSDGIIEKLEGHVLEQDLLPEIRSS